MHKSHSVDTLCLELVEPNPNALKEHFNWVILSNLQILRGVVTALLYIPTNNQEVFLLSTPFPAFVICRFFNDGHSDQCEVVSEKAMAPHSSTLAWKIPWTEEPGGLQSMGSLRVGHN